MGDDCIIIKKPMHKFLTKLLKFQIIVLYGFYFLYSLIFDYLNWNLSAFDLITFFIYALKALPVVFLFPVFAYLCVQKKKTALEIPFRLNVLDFLMILFGFYQLLSLTIGLVNGNNLFYVFGDAFGLLLVVIFYFLTRYVYCMDKDAFISINKILVIFGILLSIGVLIRFGWRVSQGLPFSSGGKMIFLGISYLSVMIILFPKYLNRKAYLVILTVFLLVIFGITFTLERTHWLGIAIILGMTFLFAARNPLKKSFVRTLIVFALIFAIVVAFVPQSLILPLTQKFSITFSGDVSTMGLDTSAYSRFEEASMVWGHYLQDANLLNWLIGFGSGAEFENTSDYVRGSGSSEQSIHQVHNAYVAVFHNNGIIGLILFLLLFISASMYFWKNRNRFDDTIRVYAYANGIALLSGIIMLNFSRDFFADLLYSYMLAAIGFIQNKKYIEVSDD